MSSYNVQKLFILLVVVILVCAVLVPQIVLGEAPRLYCIPSCRY